MKIIVTFKPGAVFDTLSREITVEGPTKARRPDQGQKFWGFETMDGQTLWINEDVVATVSSRED